MSEEELDLIVRVDFPDYWRATSSYMLGIFKVKWVIAGAAAYTLIFLFLVIAFPQSKPSYELLILPAVLALGIALLYFNTKLLFASKKFLQGDVRYVFSSSGVDAVAPLSPGHTSWSEIPKAFELERDFLVFYTPERMYTIPKKCFPDAEHIEKFRRILKSRLGDKAKLK
jgi:YcxB-like protein